MFSLHDKLVTTFQLSPLLIPSLFSALQTSYGYECLYGPDITYVDQNPVTGKFYKKHDQLATGQYGRTTPESEGGRLLMIKDNLDLDFNKTYYPVTDNETTQPLFDQCHGIK